MHFKAAAAITPATMVDALQLEVLSELPILIRRECCLVMPLLLAVQPTDNDISTEQSWLQ